MLAELKKQERVLIPKVKVARNFFVRFLGLMGRTEVPKDEAVLFPKCNSIHTFFMRMCIDVVFISNTGQVVEIKKALKPWRLLSPKKGVAHTLELGANGASELGILVGDQLNCTGVF